MKIPRELATLGLFAWIAMAALHPVFQAQHFTNCVKVAEVARDCLTTPYFLFPELFIIGWNVVAAFMAGGGK